MLKEIAQFSNTLQLEREEKNTKRGREGQKGKKIRTKANRSRKKWVGSSSSRMLPPPSSSQKLFQ